MTREEAIEQAKEILEEATRCENSVSYVTSDDEEWLKMAIKALEQEPTTKENLVVGDCMKREFIEIVVNYPPADLCTYPEYKGKPYYSIKYRENGKEYVGFGTYKIEMLSQWIKEYFMPSIQPKTDVLDKIRDEIEQRPYGIANDSVIQGIKYERMIVLEIIDKYTAESEDKE